MNRRRLLEERLRHNETAHRDTDLGIRPTKIDEAVRFVVIPRRAISAVSWPLGHGPFTPNEGIGWYFLTTLIFAGLRVIGLKLRVIMAASTLLFRKLAELGAYPQKEAPIDGSIRFGRGTADVYWVGILTVAFLGAVKPV